MRSVEEIKADIATCKPCDRVRKNHICTEKECRDNWEDCYQLLLAEVHNLRAELERVKAERNAAVSDLRHYPGIAPCHICLNRRGDMKHCALGSRNCFKWRGVQKEETK